MLEGTSYLKKIDGARNIISFTVMGIVIGALIVFIGGLSYKWVFTFFMAGFIFMIAAGLGSFKRSLEALLIFSFSMTMDVHIGYIPDNDLGIFRRGIPITLTGLVLAMLYILWAWRLVHRTDKIRFFPKVSTPFVILIAWAGLSYIWAPKPAYTIYSLFGMIEMYLLFVYAINFVKSEADLSFIVKAGAITILVTSVVAIGQYAAHSTFDLEFLGTEQDIVSVMQGTSRVGGFLGHPNGLAWFLTQWLPMLLIWGVAAPSGGRRTLCLLACSLGLLALMLTFSRAGWVTFAVSTIFIASWFGRRNPKKMFPGALARFARIGILIAIIAMPLAPLVLSRVLGAADEGAAYSRIPLAQVALNVIRHNPILGVGLGNYEYVMQKYDNSPEQIETPLNKKEFPLAVHNIFLLLPAELGVGGLLLFVYILLSIFRNGFKILKIGDKLTVLFVAGLLSGVFAFALQGMFQPGGIGTTRFRPLWFMCGLVLACSVYLKNTKISQYGGRS